MKSPTPLNKILGSQPAIQRLVKQAGNLKRLNQRLSGILPTPIAQHYEVAAIKAGALTILCSSSAWATRLRLQQAKVIKGFRDLQIQTLTIQIRPVETGTTNNKAIEKTTPMSPQTSKLLVELSETTSAPKLKKALQRLSRHAKSST